MTSLAFRAASRAVVNSRSNDVSMSETPGNEGAACSVVANSPGRKRHRGSDYLRHFVELDVVEMAVQPILGEQLLVNAGRLEFAPVKHEDSVTRTDRRDAMRQKDYRPTGEEPRQRVVDQSLGVV